MRNLIQKLFCLVLLFSSLSVLANSVETDFNNGNEAYKKGDFVKALDFYNSIEKSGQNSAELFFNKANCYYRLEKNGDAILYYEKALKADNSMEEASINLAIANKLTVDKIESLPQPAIVKVYKGFLSLLNTEGWGMLSLVLSGVFLVLVLIFNLSDSSGLRKIIFSVNALNLILILVSLVFAFSAQYYDKEELILVKDNAYIKSEPTESGKDLFILHEGTKVELKHENKAWIQIKLSDGLIGWVKEGSFKKI